MASRSSTRPCINKLKVMAMACYAGSRLLSDKIKSGIVDVLLEYVWLNNEKHWTYRLQLGSAPYANIKGHISNRYILHGRQWVSRRTISWIVKAQLGPTNAPCFIYTYTGCEYTTLFSSACGNLKQLLCAYNVGPHSYKMVYKPY